MKPQQNTGTNGVRYTGHDPNSEAGGYIEIVYLPEKPKIKSNRSGLVYMGIAQNHGIAIKDKPCFTTH